ncbi:MAG: hypothetical protein WCE82_05795 [Halobacteriota archaeon]
MAIGEKLFEEKITPRGFAIKSVGSEGVESEYSVTGEITGFGRAKGVKATNMGTMRNLVRPTGITTGTAQGVMTTTDGDSVVWKLCYAGKAPGAGGKLTGTVTFMTTSEKLAWINRTICVVEGGGDDKVGTNVFYEWS